MLSLWVGCQAVPLGRDELDAPASLKGDDIGEELLGQYLQFLDHLATGLERRWSSSDRDEIYEYLTGAGQLVGRYATRLQNLLSEDLPEERRSLVIGQAALLAWLDLELTFLRAAALEGAWTLFREELDATVAELRCATGTLVEAGLETPDGIVGYDGYCVTGT
jgi:hypothetical protein